MYLIPFNLNLNSQMAPVATVMSHVTLDALSCPHGVQHCAGSWWIREVLSIQLAWSWMGSYLEGSHPAHLSWHSAPQPQVPERGLVIFFKHISFLKSYYHLGCAGSSWWCASFLSLPRVGLVTLRHAGSAFLTRGGTHVPFIGRRILNRWTTREVLRLGY